MGQAFHQSATELTVLPYLQPIVDIRTHRVAGYELLYRAPPAFHHEDTQSYIAARESNETIVAFDRSMLTRGIQVAHELSKWCRRKEASLFMNINLSGQTLSDPTLAPSIAVLAHTMPHHKMRLNIELTETAAVRDEGVLRGNLHALRQAGFGIVLDDFPQGHNTIKRLLQHKTLIDAIKLDKSLVDAARTTGDYYTVRRYADLAHHHNMLVVAEGVDSPAQARDLARQGVNFAQGYGMGIPQPLQTVLQTIFHSPDRPRLPGTPDGVTSTWHIHHNPSATPPILKS